MKMNEQKDENLRSVLREWKVNEPLPARFQEHVWQRIEKVEAAKGISLGAYLAHWLEQTFARPALAFAYVAVLLVSGITLGYSHAQQRQARMNDDLGTRYVQSVDPYQKLASR